MKIAMLIYGLDQIGGIKKHALHLAHEFVALGHLVDIYCVDYNSHYCYPDLIRGFEVKSVRLVEQPKISERRRLYGIRMAHYLWTLWNDYLDQRKLCTLISIGYDVINPHANVVNWAAASYKQQHHTPVVWLCNDFVPIASYKYEQAQNTRQKIELVAKKALTSPFAAYDRKAVRSIDKIAVLSEGVKSKMAEHYEVDPCIVRAGVDMLKFAQGDGQKVRLHHSIKNKEFLLLTVCSLMPHRRLEDVIQAVKVLVDHGEDVQYLIVGRMTQNPDYANRLQREVAASNLDNRVIFVGEISDESLPDYYHASDAFIWASDEKQSWGLAVMEAMSAGKPVIVSKANGIAEVLEDEKTAMLVPPRSPIKIVEAVMRLVKDQIFADMIAQQGKKLMSESYTWRKNAEGMLTLFEAATARSQSKSPNDNLLSRSQGS